MSEKAVYVVANLETINLSPEDVLSGTFDDEILIRMEKTIEAEEPILEELLAKRVLNSLSLLKLGSRLSSHFESLYPKIKYSYREEDGRKVYYTKGGEVDFFRPSEAVERYSYQIPPSEAINAITYFMEEGKKYTRKELLTLFSNAFEYKKKGAQVVALFNAALKRATNEGKLKVTKNYRYFL